MKAIFCVLLALSTSVRRCLTGVDVLLSTPTVSSLTIPLVYCHIKSFQRTSSVEKPWPGGEKRRDGRAAHLVEL